MSRGPDSEPPRRPRGGAKRTLLLGSVRNEPHPPAEAAAAEPVERVAEVAAVGPVESAAVEAPAAGSVEAEAAAAEPAEAPMAEAPAAGAVQARRCDQCGALYSTEARFCPFDGEPLRDAPEYRAHLDPLIGRVVAERYQVEAVLASGGMGTVYRVRHVSLGSRYAMKVLRRDLARDEQVAARLIAEAKATAAIGHPNIAAVNDFGELELSELTDQPSLKLPYYVMEYIAGDTLTQVLRRGGPLDMERVVVIISQVAEALDAAHQAGIIHRDLKPDNIQLLHEGGGERVKVLDFGVAKVMGASKLTRRGMVFGTPSYMSPEQAQGQAVDARSDIYSLGIILYECLTGRVPFTADTYMGVVTKQLFAQPPPLPEPSGLKGSPMEEVVLRCLQKEPSQRYPGMAQMVADLARAGRGAQLHPSHAPPPLKLRHDDSSQNARVELPMVSPSRTWLWLLAGLLLALVAAGWLWL